MWDSVPARGAHTLGLPSGALPPRARLRGRRIVALALARTRTRHHSRQGGLTRRRRAVPRSWPPARMDPSTAPRLPRPLEVSPRASLSSRGLPATWGARTGSMQRPDSLLCLLPSSSSKPTTPTPTQLSGTLWAPEVPTHGRFCSACYLFINYSPPSLLPFSIQLGRSSTSPQINR